MSSQGNQRLTTEEMDALLEDEEWCEFPPRKTEQHRSAAGSDFPQDAVFSQSELDRLKVMLDEMAARAADTASELVRESTKGQLVGMDHLTWEKLREEIGDSAIAFTFRVKSPDCDGLFLISTRFAAFCVNRMMGGSWLRQDSQNYLTGFHLQALKDFIKAFLTALPGQSHIVGQCGVEAGGHVEDLRLLSSFETRQDVFQISFLLQTEGISGHVMVVVPSATVRPLLLEGAEQPVGAVGSKESKPLLRRSLRETPVEVSVVLGTADVEFHDLVELQVGDLFMVNTHIQDPLDVRLNDKVKLRGYPGTLGGRIAVRLTTEGQNEAEEGKTRVENAERDTGSGERPWWLSLRPSPFGKETEERVEAPSRLRGALSDASEARKKTARAATFDEFTDTPRGTPFSLDIVTDIPVPVTVELGKTTMTVEELLNLSPGAVVPLDRMDGEPADVVVRGVCHARGEVVMVGNRFGLRITQNT